MRANIVLVILTLFFLTVHANAEGNITTTSGDIYLQPAGGKVFIDGDWMFKDNIFFNITYGQHLYFWNTGRLGDLRSGFALKDLMGEPDHRGFEFFMAGRNYTDESDPNDYALFKYNGVDAATATGVFDIRSRSGNIWLRTGNLAPIHEFSRDSASAIRYGCNGCNNIYFQDADGNWEDIHAKSITYHSTWYEGSYDDAINDLSFWTGQEHPLGFSSDSEAEGEDIGTDLGKAAQATAQVTLEIQDDVFDGQDYDSEVRGSLLERIERLERKIANLEAKCGN